jgi:hypothetical protein
VDEETAAALGILQDAAADVGLAVRCLDDATFADMARRATLRLGLRYHIRLTATGRTPSSSWSPDEATARTRFAAFVDAYRGRPGASVTLVDELQQTTLATWPERTP